MGLNRLQQTIVACAKRGEDEIIVRQRLIADIFFASTKNATLPKNGQWMFLWSCI